jgi:hypothetical protein
MYWDSGAFTLQPSNEYLMRPLNDSAKATLSDLANTFRANFPRTNFSKELNSDKPDDWTLEAYRIAANDIYPYFKTTNVITEEYERKVVEIVKRQIALGGYRLCDTILNIYKADTDAAQKL